MAGIAANFLVQPEQFTHPGTLIAATLNLLCLFTAPRHPLPTWGGYLLLFLILSVQPDIRVTVFTFFAPLIAALITYQGHPKATVIGALILWYLGSIDPISGGYVPSDVLASVIWGAILAVSILVGYTFYRITRQRRDLLSQWDDDIRHRKQTLARALHDSVATSLTSVVMRSEALSLRRELAPDISAELTAIADQARISMQEVRSLLEVLHKDTEPRTSTSEPPVAHQLSALAQSLTTHGFTVEVTGIRPHVPLNADGLVALREILAEIATNIFKYAEPGSTVGITVNDYQDDAIITVTNTPRGIPPGAHLSSGVGLPAISQLAATIGGTLRVVSSSTRWTTELHVPKAGTYTPG